LSSAFGPSGARGDAASPIVKRGPPFDRYLIANIALWLFAYVLITVRSLGMSTPMGKLVDMGVRRACVCAVSFAFCVFIKRLLLASRPWPRGRRLLLAAWLSVLGGVFYLIMPYAAFKGPLAEKVFALTLNFSVLIWTFIVWCAVVFALDYDAEARAQALQLVEAQALAAESQNQMLRYQINPHFLFNTLNALSSLILQKDFERAERMVLSLSTFLRASLEKAPGDKITLAEELEAQRQYLAIEQERFGERLRLSETLPLSLRGALTPGLILQPLIENAVKYGVARTTQPVSIEIVAEERAGKLIVTVRDDAVPGMSPSGAEAPVTLGVGLTNVRRRLAVLYGEAGVLTCGPRLGGGFAATIELPLERRQ
jgi:two-component system LytT family sensor kinase